MLRRQVEIARPTVPPAEAARAHEAQVKALMAERTAPMRGGFHERRAEAGVPHRENREAHGLMSIPPTETITSPEMTNEPLHDNYEPKAQATVAVDEKRTPQPNFSEPLSKPIDTTTKTADYGPDFKVEQTHLPQQSETRVLAITDQRGITGYQFKDPKPPDSQGGGGSQGTTLGGKPGHGMAYLVDYDGNATNQDNSDSIDVQNLSPLPIGGPALVELILIGEHWFFAHPPTMVHAKVASQISPCAGNTPGTGMVQPYNDSGGTITSIGSQLFTKSWYKVTAQVGQYCTVSWIDGEVWLEVLDCPSS